jgi:5'(3')-deoxyribonucleotidase
MQLGHRIDPRRVAFDIDGVVANTIQLFIDIARDDYGIHHLSPQIVTSYDLNKCLDIEPDIIAAIVERITEGNYDCRLDPIPGAVEVLKRLKAFGPIRMVTARPKLGPIKKWVNRILDADSDDILVVATGSFEAKPGALKQHNITCFVDDRLDTCYLLQGQNITPIVYVQPWNRENHPFTEVDGWQQIEMLIDWNGSAEQAVKTDPSIDLTECA